jgi:hypothetical protein
MAFPPVATPANAYTLTLSDGTTIAVASGSYTTIGGLDLPGPNEVITAVQLSDNFLHITERFASTVAPANPLIGHLWYDKNSPAQLKYWDGVKWLPINIIEDLVDPANTTIVPAPSGGTGISANPYILTDTAISGTRTLIANVTVTGLSPGTIIDIVDLNGGVNGGRYEFTNKIVDGTGTLVFDIYLNDQPPSVGGTVYTGAIKIGTSSAYVDITVTMNANFPQSVNYPTGVTSSSTAWSVANDTLTPSGCLELSNDNVTWVTNPATLSISTGQTLYTRWAGSAGSGTCIDSADGVTINGSITNSLGGVSNGSLTIDKTPSAITFTALTGVALSTVTDSNTVTVGGFNSYAYIIGSTTGTTLEASINGGAWTAVPAAGTSMYITSGQTLELRHTTGATNSTAYVATIDVGGLTGVTFSTTTVAIVPTVNTPSITTPVTGSTGISRTLTITGSAYSAINGAGAHASTDWEIYSDAGLTTPVAAASSSADAVNLTSYTVPTGALAFNTQYWVRIRYRDNSGTPVVSAYSTVVDFTTTQQLGLTWTYRGTPLYGAAYGFWDGTQYVTTDEGGTFAQKSTDGINWTAINTIPVSTYMYDIYFDGTTYWSASGSTGVYALYKSTDLVTWTAVPVGGTQVTYSVTSNGTGTVVTTGDFGEVCYSTDNGVTWGSTVIWGGGSTADVWRVRYANGVFVAVGRSGISTSTDGSTWTYRGTGGAGFFRTVDYNPDLGEWFANDDSGNFVVSTDNGVTWSIKSVTPVTYVIGWDGTQYWVGAQWSTLNSSPDGITWTDKSPVINASGYSGGSSVVMSNGSQLVVVSRVNSNIATSP